MLASQEGGMIEQQWNIMTATDMMVQAARVRELQLAYRRAEEVYTRKDGPTAGQIRNLGLLGKEEDTKAVLGK